MKGQTLNLTAGCEVADRAFPVRCWNCCTPLCCEEHAFVVDGFGAYCANCYALWRAGHPVWRDPAWLTWEQLLT